MNIICIKYAFLIVIRLEGQHFKKIDNLERAGKIMAVSSLNTIFFYFIDFCYTLTFSQLWYLKNLKLYYSSLLVYSVILNVTVTLILNLFHSSITWHVDLTLALSSRCHPSSWSKRFYQLLLLMFLIIYKASNIFK